MKTSNRGVRFTRAVSAFALAAGVSWSGAALAQTEAQPAEEAEQEVVVTGLRGSLESALNAKRESNDIVDVINAQDMADFPDANVAESLQRVPGISIERDAGEGRNITVSGLGGDFSRVRLNARPVDERTLRAITSFVLLYVGVFAVGTLLLVLEAARTDFDLRLIDAIAASAATLGNGGSAKAVDSRAFRDSRVSSSSLMASAGMPSLIA